MIYHWLSYIIFGLLSLSLVACNTDKIDKLQKQNDELSKKSLDQLVSVKCNCNTIIHETYTYADADDGNLTMRSDVCDGDDTKCYVYKTLIIRGTGETFSKAKDAINASCKKSTKADGYIFEGVSDCEIVKNPDS